MPSTALATHARSLLMERRCGQCAEPISASLALRGGACPHCDANVHDLPGVDAEAVVADVSSRWGRYRWPAYALVFTGHLVTGWLPLVPALLALACLLFLHGWVVRRPLLWLLPMRRVAVRMTLALTMASLVALELLVNLLVLPFVGVNALLVALSAALFVAAYVELALRFVAGRLRRQAAGPGLDWWEWALPASLLTVVGGLSLGTMGVVSLILLALSYADIPGISDVANLVLSAGGSP